MVHKIKLKILPNYLGKFMVSLNETHKYNTRQAAKNHHRLPKYLKSNSQNSLQYRGIKMYDALPKEVKSTTLKQFKNLLKNYVKNNTQLL